MSYQTGTATGPIDILQKFATWVATLGWIVDSSIAVGTGWRLHIHKGSVYMNFRALANESYTLAYTSSNSFSNVYAICLTGGTGYNSANDWRTQAGVPVRTDTSATLGCGMPLPSGSVSAYHFFGDAAGDNVVVVVEKTTGIFGQMFFGVSLNKVGTWIGGAYFGASKGPDSCTNPTTYSEPGCALSTRAPSTWNGNTCMMYVRADVDSWVNKWLCISNATTLGYGYTGKNGGSIISEQSNSMLGYGLDISWLINRGTSSMSGQSTMIPLLIFAVRDAGGTTMIGYIPNIFLCNACNDGFSASGLYQWGSDSYRVFPGHTQYALTKDYGFAVKQVN